MATQAQVLANQANAQHSTGPRTEEGKAKSSANSKTHGFSTGVLSIKPEDRPEFDALGKSMIEESKPEGALEMDAIREIRDAAWRLRQIRQMTHQLFVQHSEDPFTNPEGQAAMRQLNRYRAAAEMSFHRALATLRDLQTIRLGRMIHLTKSENEAIGPLADPRVFAFMNIEGHQMNRFNRDRFDEFHDMAGNSFA
jgi:hypothetical protein